VDKARQGDSPRRGGSGPVLNRTLYGLRNRSERFTSRLKNSRRIAIRYDHTSSNFLGCILLAAFRHWILFTQHRISSRATAPARLGSEPRRIGRTPQEERRLKGFASLTIEKPAGQAAFMDTKGQVVFARFHAVAREVRVRSQIPIWVE